MAKTLCLNQSVPGYSAGVNITHYNPIVGGLGAITTESRAQINSRGAGVYSNLTAVVISNSYTADTTTVKFRKNAANGNQALSISAGATGTFEDTTNTDTTADGDDVCTQRLVTNTGSGTCSFLAISVVFDATSNTMSILVCNSNAEAGASLNSASATRYNALSGVYLTVTTTESQVQHEVRLSGTLKNFQINVATNARTTTTTYRTRKNTANGNCTISVGSTATGVFEDIASTDSVVSGDLINSSFTTGTGSGTAISVNLAKIGYETTDSHYLVLGSTFGGDAVAISLTRYYGIGGYALANATETNTQHKVYYTETAKNIGISISANTISATSTVTLRKNTADTAAVISITASTTGFFEDTSNTVSLAAADLINFKIVTGGTGTNLNVRTVSIYFEVTAGPTLFTTSITESSIAVSETNTRLLTANRALSDTVVVSETLARRLTAMRSLSESSIAVSETVNRVPVWVRSLSDTVIVSETVARLLTANRSLADTVTISDSLARVFFAFRTIVETPVTVSDSLVRRLTANRSLAESTISVSETLTRLLIAVRALVDTIAVSDTVLAIKIGAVIVRSITESAIAVSETLARSLLSFRTISESTIAVSDSVARVLVALRSLSESSIAVSETLARTSIKLRSLPETVTVSDSLTKLLTAARSLAETVTVSETVSRLLSAFRTLADTVVVSDSLARTPVRVRSIAESSIAVSDTVARLLTAFRTFSESSIAVSDSLTKLLTATRAITETVVVSETLARQLLAFRTLAQSAITVSDTLARMIAVFRTISEPSISISETLARMLKAFRTIAETPISVSETVARQIVPITVISETVAVSDSIARLLKANRSLADTVTVSDILAAARLRVRLIAESAITVSDSLVRRLTAFRVIGETVVVSDVLLIVGPDYEIAVYIGDRGYANPLRTRIQFINRAEPFNTFYTYDSFNPDIRPFNIINMSVRLAQGEIGTFSMVIEDSAGIVDKAKIGLGVKVVIEAKKEFGSPYFKLITGFVRRIRPLRPATGALLYEVTGYGSQVIFNERIVNFKRAAKRTAVDSTIPLSTESRMQAHRLFTDLITATDIIPLKAPTIQATGKFELTAISPEVTDFIAQIAPGLTDAASVANAIAEITGAIWGTDADGNPFFRYPTQVHSGILVKDAPESTDSALNTSVNLDAFDFDDSIDVSEGFANRLYVLNAVDTKSTASSGGGLGSTTLTTRWLAQQWTATDNNVTSAAFVLSKVGNPTNATGSIQGKLRQDNLGYPTGATLASFEITLDQIETSRSTIFVNDIKTETSAIVPGSKYWWVLVGNFQDDSNTVRWHNDNDLSTPNRLSAQLPVVDADPTKPGIQANWVRSVFGPVYAFSTFSSVRHILTQSDSESIKQFGLIEGIVDLPAFEDDATFQKALAKIIYTSAKPKRTYEYARLTIPTQRIFYPGELITVIDSKANLTSEKNVMAEIAEVNYNFDTGSNAVGCKYVDIRLVAFLDKALDDYMDTREC